jgi:2-polyprenyl-6-hydroxyphenyl methylase / 3-demethylubiquinone-9 3-methyltransferase
MAETQRKSTMGLFTMLAGCMAASPGPAHRPQPAPGSAASVTSRLSKQADSPEPAEVDPREVERFAAMAADWWDPNGKFRPLHAMNPVRAAYVRDQFLRSLSPKATPDQNRPLSGYRLLDVGCGGGLLTETLSRWGADIVGIDVGEEAIAVARKHADDAGLTIDYRCATVKDMVALQASGGQLPFDGVVALEVVEHVPDPADFCKSLASLTRPDGRIVMSTVNRTRASYLTAIIGAEYILGWLPRGTHDWNRFLKPSELAGALRRAGMIVDDVTGMVPETPTGRRWRLSRSTLAVNYLISSRKQDAGSAAPLNQF